MCSRARAITRREIRQRVSLNFVDRDRKKAKFKPTLYPKLSPLQLNELTALLPRKLPPG